MRQRRVEVAEDKLVLTGPGEDEVLDVLFDDRRVWSFWSMRDTEPVRRGSREIGWPAGMRRYLNGQVRVAVRTADGSSLFEDDLRFGSGQGRVRFETARGEALTVDKSGRIAVSFEEADDRLRAELLDAARVVVDALEDAGATTFVAYGTLLGAEREGSLIAHDNDVDLAVLCARGHPVDVMVESFRLQRLLTDAGFATTRYSGAGFRVDAPGGGGRLHGIDVFSAFFNDVDQLLYVMGEVGAPFHREWLLPLGTATIDGRAFPAPAQPARLLTATYGPTWTVPDPAFKFETPAAVSRRLNGWFRGIRQGRRWWDRAYSVSRHRMPAEEPSALARFAVEHGGVPGRVVELGAGRGADALWLARQGASVTAYDLVVGASRPVQRVADEEGLSLEVRFLNLAELRSVLGVGARIAWANNAAGAQAPVTVVAHHLFDAIGPAARQDAWRLISMALRAGGRGYVEVWTDGAEPRTGLHRMWMGNLAAGARAAGLKILERIDGVAVKMPDNDSDSVMGRLVVQWRG